MVVNFFLISTYFVSTECQRGGMARAMASFSQAQSQSESAAGWSAPAGAAISVAGRQANHPAPTPTQVVWSGCSLGVCDSRVEVPINPPVFQAPAPVPFKQDPIFSPTPSPPPFKYVSPPPMFVVSPPPFKPYVDNSPLFNIPRYQAPTPTPSHGRRLGDPYQPGYMRFM